MGNLIGYLITALVLCSGCGQAPQPTITPAATLVATAQPTSVDEPSAPEPMPSATPTPVVTNAPLVFFDFYNSPGICNAVRNWNPAASTIQFPAQGADISRYTFGATGITAGNSDGTNTFLIQSPTTTITMAGALGHPPLCVITITTDTPVGGPTHQNVSIQ